METQTIDKQKIRGILLNLVAKNRQVIYGATSVNYYLPPHLRRETKDIDILTKKPKMYAEEAVRELNKNIKNGFRVEEAKHVGTFKVKDVKTGKTIADYTRTTKQPKSYNLFGVRFATEKYSEGKLKKVLRDEASKHRWEKDRDTLQRIKQARKGISW